MFKVCAPVVQEDFIGRKAEIQRIVSAMKLGNNISIYGMARIGKTSIVKEIIRRAENRQIFDKTPLFFEYRLTQDKNIRFLFFEDLKDFIAAKLDDCGSDNTKDGISIKKLISRVEKGLDNGSVNHERYIRLCEKLTSLYDNDLWIIIDEMDYANSAFGDYIQKIREIVNSCDRVHIINVSRHSLSSIFPISGNGSNYPGIVSQNIPIVGFFQDEIDCFEKKFIADIGDEKGKMFWEDIIKYAGNVPYFIAILSNGIQENPNLSVREIAENPYGKYIETLRHWYQALYSDNMLENAIKYIEKPEQADLKNLTVFGIIKNGAFTVPWFGEYIKKKNVFGDNSDLYEKYSNSKKRIIVLLNQGKKVLLGLMRDSAIFETVTESLDELEAMKIKIDCMDELNVKNTFVKILPSIEEVNTFDTKLRNIKDLFERLN